MLTSEPPRNCVGGLLRWMTLTRREGNNDRRSGTARAQCDEPIADSRRQHRHFQGAMKKKLALSLCLAVATWYMPLQSAGGLSARSPRLRQRTARGSGWGKRGSFGDVGSMSGYGEALLRAVKAR